MKTDRNKTKTRSGTRPPEATPLISQTLQEELLRFMENHPANRVNRNLRKMLLEYLMHESSAENFYFKDLLYDLEGIFELLDAIEMETEMNSNKAGK